MCHHSSVYQVLVSSTAQNSHYKPNPEKKFANALFSKLNSMCVCVCGGGYGLSFSINNDQKLEEGLDNPNTT